MVDNRKNSLVYYFENDNLLRSKNQALKEY